MAEDDKTVDGGKIGYGKAFPVFLTEDVPPEILDELLSAHVENDLADGSNKIVSLDAIKTTDLKQITHGDSRPSLPLSSPFHNWTPHEIYEYWNNNVRNPPTTEFLRENHWANFVFAILDTVSVTNRDILLCSDGPDFYEGNPETGEDEIKLKCIRTTFKNFIQSMCTVEFLGCTPSEIHKERHMKVVPPVVMVPHAEQTEDNFISGRIASAAEMRQAKRRALWSAQAQGIIVDGQIKPDLDMPPAKGSKQS